MSAGLSTLVQTAGASIVHFSGGGGRIVPGTANGGDLAIGLIVTIFGETTSDYDLCGVNEMPTGVVYGQANVPIDLSYDPDSPFDDNTELRIRLPGYNEEIWLISAPSVAIARGAPIGVDASNPGYVSSWAYTNATQATDCLLSVVGQALQTITAVASKYKGILARWRA